MAKSKKDIESKIEHEKEYIEFLRKRVESENYMNNVSKEEFDMTKEKYKKAKEKLKMLKLLL